MREACGDSPEFLKPRKVSGNRKNAQELTLECQKCGDRSMAGS